MLKWFNSTIIYWLKDQKSRLKCWLNDRKWLNSIKNVIINYIFDLFQPFSNDFEYNECIYDHFFILIKATGFGTIQLKLDLF